MKSDFSTKVTGWSFIAAALMLLLGWILLPTHIGTFFQPGDFAAVHAQWTFWIWMYRIHIFGLVVATMALVALGALLSESAARILIWPGVAMAGTGIMVTALAAAFTTILVPGGPWTWTENLQRTSSPSWSHCG